MTKPPSDDLSMEDRAKEIIREIEAAAWADNYRTHRILPFVIDHFTRAQSRAKIEAYNTVISALNREIDYHQFLYNKGDVRHPILACKEVLHYVRACINSEKAKESK